MSQIQSGDRVRHPSRGIGTVERIERNAFGKVTRASVRFSGVLVPNLWIDDLALFETAPPPEFVPQVVPSTPSAA